MPTITHENIDELNAIITIELAKDDYLPKVNTKLKEYRQKAQIKGFRPGKVPMGMIKRKFGTALLIDEVNEIVGENMNKYFNDNKMKVLGQPLPVEDKKITLSINKPEDYSFQFELGLAPEFDIQGLSTDTQLPFYDIEVADDEVAAELEEVRKKYGAGFQEGVTDITEEDMLTISLVELDENGAIKEEGVVKEETYLALRDITSEDLKNNLLSATLEDTFDFDIYSIEDKEPSYIRKHILSIDENAEINNMFRLTIKEIKRIQKAELNIAFFEQLFPDQGIETEEAFVEKIKEEIYKGYKQSALNHYTNMVFDYLIENNQPELPKGFLEKWLKVSQENLTNEFFQGEEFEGFLKNLRWSLIREKLAEQFKVEVKYQDVENMTRSEILRYFNYQIPPYGEMMDNMLERILSDQKEVNRRFEILMDQRVLENAAENMGKDMKPATKEEFEAIIKEYQDSKNPPAVETAKEEEKVEETVATEE